MFSEMSPEDMAALQAMGIPTSFGANKQQAAAQHKKRTIDAPPAKETLKKPKEEPKLLDPAALPLPPSVAAAQAQALQSAVTVGPPKPSTGSDAPVSVGPPLPPGFNRDAPILEDDEESEENERIPIAYEVVLAGHSKTISAIGVDPPGARVVTGSYDYSVKFWDFAGMDQSLRSFRTLDEPVGGYQIKTLAFSQGGDQILVVPGSSQAKMFDRDGFEICEYVKGDMYLTDMANTKGHVAAITNAVWEPNDRETFITGSADGTVRIWNANDDKKQKHILKIKNARSVRANVNYCTYSLDSRWIAVATSEGSIQLWSATGPYARPQHEMRTAHQNGSDTTCLAFSRDHNTLLSRAMDDTLKVWDIRKFVKPLHVFAGVDNHLPQTDCLFNPEDDLIITGTCVRKNEGIGSLLFWDKKTFQLHKQIPVGPGSVQRIVWHPKINQLLVGSTDAKVRVYYDTNLSKAGALLSVTHATKKRDPAAIVEPDRPVFNPHTLPMFKPEPSSQRKKAKERLDPIKSKKPDIPTTGPEVGPRIGSSHTHHLLKNMVKNTTRDEDPREAILKYAKEAAENPYWFKAYSATQPKPVFDTTPETEDQTIAKPKSAKK